MTSNSQLETADRKTRWRRRIASGLLLIWGGGSLGYLQIQENLDLVDFENSIETFHHECGWPCSYWRVATVYDLSILPTGSVTLRPTLISTDSWGYTLLALNVSFCLVLFLCTLFVAEKLFVQPRKPWQFSLMSLLKLLTVTAITLSYYLNESTILVSILNSMTENISYYLLTFSFTEPWHIKATRMLAIACFFYTLLWSAGWLLNRLTRWRLSVGLQDSRAK